VALAFPPAGTPKLLIAGGNGLVQSGEPALNLWKMCPLWT
jgi:hypothetical protein